MLRAPGTNGMNSVLPHRQERNEFRSTASRLFCRTEFIPFALEAAIVADGKIPGLRPSAFVPLDEQRAVRIYQRNLPHWRQEGCAYFVTFRLGDSIPDGVRRRWEYEKQMWLKRHGIEYDGKQGRW